MIELIVVIVMLGVLSAVAYPRITSDGFDEAGYRDQVAATLAFARKAAVAQRRYVQIGLNANALSLRIGNAVPESGAPLTLNGTAGRDLIVPGTSSAQIAPRGRTTLSGPALLFFTPLGAATSPTTFVYTVAGSATRTLTVDPATGYVQ